MKSFWLFTFACAFAFLPAEAAETTLGVIPDYPGSQVLCDEHLSGNTMHIQWKSFSTRDPVPVVENFFEQKLGVKAAAGEHDSRKFVHPSNGDLIFTLYPKQRAEFFPNCTRKPEPTAETLILISQGIRGPAQSSVPGTVAPSTPPK